MGEAQTGLPPELLEHVAKRDYVLFLGDQLAAGAPDEPGGLPTLAALAGELAAATGAWDECRACREAGRCLHPADCALPFPEAEVGLWVVSLRLRVEAPCGG